MAIAAAAVMALGATACDPPPAPDGRDLGVVVDALPATVETGTSVQVTGTLTNHGTTAADGVKFGYGVTGGFTVDAATLGSGSTCVVQSALSVECTLDAPLAPSESRPVTVDLTAGATFGPTTHVAAASSAGSEPADDADPNVVAFDLRVVPPAADPVLVDIGGDTNYLGTGSLVGASGSGRPSENLYLSVNPYCTAKVQGDRYQAGYDPTGTPSPCKEPQNPEYRAAGYSYAIDVPANRTSSIDVLLWDARYDWNGTDAIDSARTQGSETFTFTLYAADNTPLDPNDNPLVCAQAFGSDTAFDYGPYLGSDRWNRLCSISPSDPAGRYILRVRNGGAAADPVADGNNEFGVVAAYVADGGDPAASLCDRASRADCPTISGPGEASIRIAMDTNTARLPLGGVGAEHDGRMLRLELFDPGEGMAGIRLLAPTGAGTWAPSPFTWTSPTVGGTGATTTFLDVTSSRFNGKLVTLEVDLAGYEPPPGNDVWLVEYVAAPGYVITDRTTWNAAILDHP